MAISGGMAVPNNFVPVSVPFNNSFMSTMMIPSTAFVYTNPNPNDSTSSDYVQQPYVQYKQPETYQVRQDDVIVVVPCVSSEKESNFKQESFCTNVQDPFQK